MICRETDVSRAIRYLSRAIELDKNFASAYFVRGLCYAIEEQDELAKADLGKAQLLTKDPDLLSQISEALDMLSP